MVLLLSLQKTSVSVLEGSECAIESAIRRKTKDSILRPSSALRSLLSNISASEARASRPAEIGPSKTDLNVDKFPRAFGRTKSVNANNSSKLFCKGVPVRIIRRAVGKAAKAVSVFEPPIFFSR